MILPYVAPHCPTLWVQSPEEWALCDLLTPAGFAGIVPGYRAWKDTEQAQQMAKAGAARFAR